MGVEALEDVLDKGGVGAVAVAVGVVLAAQLEDPGVQALGNDVRARQGDDGARSSDGGAGNVDGSTGDVDGGARSARGRARSARSRGGRTRGSDGRAGQAGSGDRGQDGRLGLGDLGDSGRDGDRHGDDSSGGAARAVLDVLSAREDSRDLGGEDGRSAGDDGDHGRSDRSGSSRRLANGVLGGLAGGSSSLGRRHAGRASALGRLAGGILGRLAGGILGRLAAGVLGGLASSVLGRQRAGAGDLRRLAGGGDLGRQARGLLGGLAGLLGRLGALGGSLGGLAGGSDLGRLARGLDGRSGLRRTGGAVEADAGDSDTTVLLGLVGLGRVNNGNTLGTTALGVLDRGTALLARRTLTASRSVRHAVVELKVTVELGRHVEGVQRELVLGVEAGAVTLVARGTTVDHLARGTAVEVATAGEGLVLLALPALEVEVVIAAELARVEVTPVEPTSLLGLALVVSVGGALEGVGALEGSRGPGDQG